MKIQGLAVLAIILILPMAIILNSYSANEIKTVDLQMNYDSRLKVATYDGIKAFQMNMSNSMTSNFSDSKMRDIKAAIKTFYNSLASQFSMTGYGEDVLQDYVPAIVYTLYDGYYIYSDYNNDLDVYEPNNNEDGDRFYSDATYKNGEDLYGLKPYVYYSCRYKRDGVFDVVITYSLDSYITIQGTIGINTPVNTAGYLLSNVSVSNVSASDDYTVRYRGIEIPAEQDKLRQRIYIPEEKPIPSDENRNIVSITYKNEIKTAGVIRNYPYRRINGTKYYVNSDRGGIFSLLNDNILTSTNPDETLVTINTNAKEFYKAASDFKTRIQSGDLVALKELSTTDAVDENGNKYSTYTDDSNPYPNDIRIFDELFNTSGTSIEDENSDFNMHRKQVIRNSIESNLIVAISNYNKVSSSGASFAMPKLKDEEWEELTTNISMITFLQGLNIGGKIYSGYAYVPNDINEDFVSEDSIYILVDGTYYRVTDENLKTKSLSNAIGLYNTDFERRTVETNYSEGDKDPDKVKKNVYYYPREDEGAYSSIINLNSDNGINLKNPTETWEINLAQLYYTALGRERYGMYRVNNPFTNPFESKSDASESGP